VTAQHGHLKLLNPAKRVHEVLVLTKLDSVFEIFTDEAAVLRSFETPRPV